MTLGNYEVMLDDTSINVSKEVDMVWSIANSLRGPYTSDKYRDVVIPMIIIRRFECALAETKDGVVAVYTKNPGIPAAVLEQISGFVFYNTSQFTLKNLLNDPDNLVANFISYIEGFSPNVQAIIRNLEFSKQIEKMDKNNRLYSVVKKFSELDLNPKTIDGMKMGYMFEDLIRRFSENAEAGDHYTPREVIRLMVNILLAEGCDDLLTNEGKVVTVLDPACGTGGMLSTTQDFLRRKNPGIDVRLFGQEINPESYAICLADMLIKGQNAENIRGGDLANTLMYDCFPDQKMRLAIMNPPFGTKWGGEDAPTGVEKAVNDEYQKGFAGRFGAGLPGKSDSQLLFMQHALSKLDERVGRAAIITNGSPLFSGGTASGESQIRRWMLESDLLEAIIALPEQLFYNTGIGIYVFVFSQNKRPERRGKVQLINAVEMFQPLRKSLGNKRREIDRESMKRVTELYAEFAENKYSKIFPNTEFLYREFSVYQPLQRRGRISAASVAALENSDYFTNNGDIFKQSEFEMLAEMEIRDAKPEKKYQKYLQGQQFVQDVLLVLKQNISDTEYPDFREFKIVLKKFLSDVSGYTNSRMESIAMILSEMDKSVVIQRDKSGNPIPDKSTKDTELVKLNKDVEEYFAEEVLPHVPDAIRIFEETEKTIKTGAEFPFTRYFYEYKAPEKSEVLLAEFLKLEGGLSEKIAGLRNTGDF